MGGCQKHGTLLGTLNTWGRTRMGTQKGTVILTTTHITVRPAGQNSTMGQQLSISPCAVGLAKQRV